MSNDKTGFYITSPIYYVNARPHIGHTYTTVVCDAIARRQRMLGRDTCFLTGTDEHGQKIERSAAAAGKTPQQLADEISAGFRSLWDRMGIRYDRFMRTTDPRHEAGVQEMFRRLRDKDFIYKGSYTGQYCVFDELYVGENAAPGAPCPECGRPTETVSEQNYFFKLSAFEDQLLNLYERQPDFIYPEARRNEVISFVRSGLRDLSVSRGNIKWGIPVPDDPEQVMYVWLDALCTYMTGVGFTWDMPQWQRYWPANVHMIGKEIVRFHCVYWPAFLMAAGLPVQHRVIAHGWLLFEQDKMSKSKGNIVRAESILDVLGADALRYFLFREIAFGHDGSFSFDALVQRYNADLANGLGNLASRTLTMIAKYFEGEMPYPSATAARTSAEDAIENQAVETIANFNALWDEYQFSRALESLWGLVAAVDKYIVETAPWAVAEKQDENSRARLATILFTTAEALRIITVLAHPVIPDSTTRIWQQIGLSELEKFPLSTLKWGQLNVGVKISKVEPVFPRADKSTIEAMQNKELPPVTSEVKPAASAAIPTPERKAAKLPGKPAAKPSIVAEATTSTPVAPAAVPAPAQAAPAPQPSVAEGKISIEDFAKVELRVAQVKTAEKVKGADKLLRLEVDLGDHTRQIVAGIAEAYAPEGLVGRKIVVVTNLQPRKLRGLVSDGMLLAATIEGGKPVLAGFLEDVPVGARLK
jgi:methionyl-tRNA synthetase